MNWSLGCESVIPALGVHRVDEQTEKTLRGKYQTEEHSEKE